MLTPRQLIFLVASTLSGLVLGLGLVFLVPAATTSPAAAALAPAVATPAPAASLTPIATLTLSAAPSATPSATATPMLEATPKPTPKPVVTVVPPAAPAATPVATPAPLSPYTGQNHFWYPALGINHDVGSFTICDGTVSPGQSVYLWSCARPGNTYLLAHAAYSFRPLYLAYEAGTLQVGQSVWYANAAGQVSHYQVAFWKIVGPADATNTWVWGGSATPIMTLQTCTDAASTQILIVRLTLAP